MPPLLRKLTFLKESFHTCAPWSLQQLFLVNDQLQLEETSRSFPGSCYVLHLFYTLAEVFATVDFVDQRLWGFFQVSG